GLHAELAHAAQPRAGTAGERPTADEMDEQRRQNVAYQYLCHLEEAKRWMEACLGEGLPPPTELEETLRNGVLLAKLGHCFAPAVVPLKKIYDPEQTRYKTAGLHFRHTDNINYWRDAMSHVGLPSIFHPETTDIYDKKNMPRVVYCIHALSFYLFKLGLAPPIQDLYGKVNFTEEEINNMKRELEKYGLQLPAFSKIGGILANELSVDEAAVHAAVLAINEAVERGVVAQTMETLQNPHAMLVGLRQELAGAYQEVLNQAKLEKGSSARSRVRRAQGALGWLGEEQSLLLQAVGQINAAVRQGMPAKTLEALMDPAAQLPDVHPPAAPLYQQQLALLQSQHPRGELTQEELFVAVEMLSAVALVNQALDARNPTLHGMPQVIALFLSCRYFDDLLQLKVQLRKAGAEFLSWNDIQDSINNTNSSVQDENDRESCPHEFGCAGGRRYPGREVTLGAPENLTVPWAVTPLVPKIGGHEAMLGPAQAAGRCRVLPEPADLGGQLAVPTPRQLQQHASEPGGDAGMGRMGWVGTAGTAGAELGLSLQSVISRVTLAHERERLWASREALVVRLQARLRGFLVRRQLAAWRHVLQEQRPAAIRIQVTQPGPVPPLSTATQTKGSCLQHFLAGPGRGSACCSVVLLPGPLRFHTKSPPLSVVRRFIHLLEQSQRDFWEESEVLRLQEEVVKRIRASQQLESDLDLMDIKIGLLVKNRITLQEVVSHCKKLTKKNKEQLSEMMSMDKQKGLKMLSKEKRQKLEAYQHLFYLLQTQPVYLARLIFQMPQNKSTKFMESVIFTLYNYASSPREAYLLLQLFKVALQEEINSKVDHVHDILTGNATVIRLLVSFYRTTRGQSALRHILAGPVQEVLQDKTLSINTDPVDIYKAWINQTESQSGHRSKLPYEVSPEQALSHPEVQRRLDIAIRNLLAVTDKFVSAITSSVDKIPYGMRYMAKILRMSLVEKFPKAPAEEVDKVVGNLLYYRFMNPAVVAPDGFDIVDLSAGVALRPEQRRSLASIAKVLQHAAAHKAFQGDSAYLCGLNQYLEHTHNKFRRFISAACCVPEPEERFDMDEYSEMVAVAKPVIYITVGELITTHKLLLEHQDSITSHHSDPLNELLEDLDELPTVQSLVGSVASLGNSSAEQLSQLSRTEISLTLTNKLVPVASSEESDTRSLLLSTKQMLVDLIQCQPGDSLPDILWTPASEHEVGCHRPSLAANSQLSMEEKKRKVIRNLRRLESLGLVDSANQYQQLVDELAKDIRNQRRHRQQRRRELLKLRQTLEGLDAKTLFYEEQIDYYNQYIKTCLDNLAASNKCWESKGSRMKLPSLHYTAAQLWEKGVLLEIQDLPPSQLRNVVFDIIPCEESGRFQVKAKFMGIDMEHFQLHYQDLLQLQYEGVAVMKMFHKAKVNVNLLIFLLNKKFFKK
uniref:IQ motif containing GTPase activating protein 3 n=1 Tax=Serinus canaria TaxID=9135 RepID=A0A8C9NMZ9_SERCA